MSGTIRADRLAAQAEQGRGYDAVAKSFHWLVAALIAAQFATELIPNEWASEEALASWHVSIGPSILALMLLRLVWRLTHRPPPAPADLPPGLRVLSRATHWAFYVLLIALPLLGWTAASGFGATPYLFGVIPLPALIDKDKPTAEAIGGAHGLLAWALLAVIALHVAGALYHATVKRDGVVGRMLPAGGKAG